MIHSNRIIIASFERDMDTIIKINEEIKDIWIDDRKYSVYFGDVTDMGMV